MTTIYNYVLLRLILRSSIQIEHFWMPQTQVSQAAVERLGPNYE